METFKTHVALRVRDLNQSIAFYRNMFDLEPVKHKPGYAKFDIENPGLNLTLNTGNFGHALGRYIGRWMGNRDTVSHFGIQVESTQAVQDAIARFRTAGLAISEERNTNCCYALQDKVWVTDPDGNRWEIFVVKVADTAPEKNIDVADAPAKPQKTCCA